MSNSLPIYVINLDRVPERMQFIYEQFGPTGMGDDLQRFSALDAKAPEFVALGYCPHSWQDRWSLLPTEQACFASHRALWQQIAQGPNKAAVICEDDILVSSNCADALEQLDLDRYGVIKLDGFSVPRRYGPAMEMNGLWVRDILEAVPSAACYALSRDAARRLFEASAAYCATLDDFVFSRRTGIRPVQLFPALSVQGMCCALDASGAAPPEAVTSSERESGPAAGGQREKGPVAYRILKELRRAARKIWWLCAGDFFLKRKGGVIQCPSLSMDLPPYRR